MAAAPDTGVFEADARFLWAIEGRKASTSPTRPFHRHPPLGQPVAHPGDRLTCIINPGPPRPGTPPARCPLEGIEIRETMKRAYTFGITLRLPVGEARPIVEAMDLRAVMAWWRTERLTRWRSRPRPRSNFVGSSSPSPRVDEPRRHAQQGRRMVTLTFS